MVSGANQLEKRVEDNEASTTSSAIPYEDKESGKKSFFAPLHNSKDKNEEIQCAHKQLLETIDKDPFLQKVKKLHTKYDLELPWKGNNDQIAKLKTLNFHQICRALVQGDVIIPRTIKINGQVCYACEKQGDGTHTADRVEFLRQIMQDLNKAGFSPGKTDEDASQSSKDFFERTKEDRSSEEYLQKKPIECIPVLRGWSVGGYWHGFGVMHKKLPGLYNYNPKDKAPITYLNAINGCSYSTNIEKDLSFTASTYKVYGVFPSKEAKGKVDVTQGFFHITWTVDQYWTGRRIIRPYLGANDLANEQILKNLHPVKKGIF